MIEYETAVSLAEHFARKGDLELVISLAKNVLVRRELSPRVVSIFNYLCQQQKPDGSVLWPKFLQFYTL